MSINQSHKTLNNTVITHGFCVGCGACAVPENSPFKIVMDEYGQYQAILSDSKDLAKTSTNYEKLCPFASITPNEDEIAKQYYAKGCEYNEQIGYYKGVYAGYVNEGTFRKRGSSGGMGTWILNELLTLGLVDYIVHVKSEEGENVFINNIPFRYTISNTQEQVQQGGKSRYYPIELSAVLKIIHSQPGRYAVVGLPCFIKSVRLLQNQDTIFSERIHYCIGLVCGHLKSAHYAESLAWQMGIVPSNLKAIDFRVKSSSQPSNVYSIYAKGTNSENIVPANQLFGTDWGAGVFKYKACDFCDDVFAETADAVLGDAWLSEYVQDSCGTNVVVTRHDKIEQFIVNARSEGRLVLELLDVEKAAQSQEAGLRHKKGALSYRLHCEKGNSSWTPTMRIASFNKVKSRYEMKRQRLRTQMRCSSQSSFIDAKRANDLSVYLRTMQPFYDRYTRLGRSLFQKKFLYLIRKLIRLIK